MYMNLFFKINVYLCVYMHVYVYMNKGNWKDIQGVN